MHTCGKCQETKNIEDFAEGKKGKPHAWCKACMKEYSRQRFQNRSEKEKERRKLAGKEANIRSRKFTYEYLLNHPCVDCGEADPVVLQFDHQGSKDANVSDLAKTSLNRIKQEIEKCEVRCVNCHSLKTAKERGYYQWLPEELYDAYLR